MTALDTSTLVAYLEGGRGADIEAADAAIAHKAAVLPPVVLTELLSVPGLAAAVRSVLRGRVRARGAKAGLADTLIARSCIDHHVGLITRDRDFRHFAKHGLTLVA